MVIRQKSHLNQSINFIEVPQKDIFTTKTINGLIIITADCGFVGNWHIGS